MAGRPMERAFEARLAKNGGWSALLDRVAAGEKLVTIAADYGVSRSWLNTILLFRDEERRKLYQEARRHSAAALAEQALEIADGVAQDKDAVAAARLQIEQRRWLASKYDREQFGDDVAPAVQINLGDLHIAAIKKVQAAHAQKSLPAPKPQLTSGQET